jgi:Ca2+-transporting ATPase
MWPLRINRVIGGIKAALALSTEPPSPDLLQRPPNGLNEPLITSLMWKNIIGQAAYQLLVNFYVLYYAPAAFGLEYLGREHLTVFFNVFVMCQIFNEVNCRKIHGEKNIFENIFKNTAFVSVLLFTMVVQFLFVEFGGEFAGTVPLSLYWWLYSIGLGAIGIPINYLLKIKVTKKKVESKNRISRKNEKSQNEDQSNFCFFSRTLPSKRPTGPPRAQ